MLDAVMAYFQGACRRSGRRGRPIGGRPARHEAKAEGGHRSSWSGSRRGNRPRRCPNDAWPFNASACGERGQCALTLDVSRRITDRDCVVVRHPQCKRYRHRDRESVFARQPHLRRHHGPQNLPAWRGRQGDGECDEPVRDDMLGVDSLPPFLLPDRGRMPAECHDPWIFQRHYPGIQCIAGSLLPELFKPAPRCASVAEQRSHGPGTLWGERARGLPARLPTRGDVGGDRGLEWCHGGRFTVAFNDDRV